MDITPVDLALRQLHEYRSAEPGMYFAENHPALTLDEAYAVQDQVARVRAQDGDRVVGYKIGCIGPLIREKFGMDGPIRGFLYEAEIQKSGATLHASMYTNLAVEAEMAIIVGNDLAAGIAFPVIELHNYVFRADAPTLQELIVNNGLNAGVVLPDFTSSALSLDCQGVLEIRINDARVEQGPLWDTSCSPQAMFAWLCGHLEAHGLAVRPGHIILTGTLLGLYRVNPGDQITVIANETITVEATVAA